MKIKGVKLVKGDLIIIFFVLALAILIFLIMIPKSYAKTEAQIYVNGSLVQSVQLKSDTKKEIVIEQNVKNVIEIDGLKVRVKQSTCIDHLCESKGYISKAGEVIVCMPNKLLVKIVGQNASSDVDFVVG